MDELDLDHFHLHLLGPDAPTDELPAARDRPLENLDLWGHIPDLISYPDAPAPGPGADCSGAGSDEHLVQLWLFDKARKTTQAYARHFAAFSEFVGGKPLSLVTLSDVQGYVSSLEEAGDLTPATLVMALSAIKSIFTFGHEVGYLRFNVGRAIKTPPAKDTLAERILSEADVRKLINLGAKCERDRVILMTFYAGALRLQELCDLKWRDVTPSSRDRPGGESGSGQLNVFGKGGKTGVVLLPPAVFSRIVALRGDPPYGEDEPVFRSRILRSRKPGKQESRHMDAGTVYKIVKAAAVRAGVAGNVSPHWLRHSHATHAMEAGAEIALVQKTLRHSSIATTGRYLHARPNDSSGMYLGF